MVYAASRISGKNMDDARRPESRGNIEETLPLNHQAVRQDKNRGTSWTSIVILLAVLIGFITLIKEVNESQHSGLGQDARLSYFHNWFVNAGSNLTIATHLWELTRRQHVGGTPNDMQTALYVEKIFEKYGLPAHTVDYEVLLSYPVFRSLVLHSPFTALQRLVWIEDGDRNKSFIEPYHAYSPSGNVTGPVVYVNYGREEDYHLLSEMGIDVRGCIVIARYGDVYRGSIVSEAAKAGAVAVIVYSDPQQFGGNGSHGFFPVAKWLPSDAIQGGTVLQGVGDPSTPGWPSTPNAERLSPNSKLMFPTIPSMPISADEAHHILMSLSGPALPTTWTSSLLFNAVGRGPAILNFSYVENKTMAKIRNVFAVITGSQEPDRFVVIGNHRDAWTYGAVDPNSGTAALLEIARNFGALLRKGWRPRRSIVLCSWDAEEFGMIGSTEWVEQNLGNVGAKAVAYLNVDCAVQGPGFFAAATPQLDDLLIQVTKQVRDPDSHYNTVYESWASASNGTASKVSIGRLGGGGSDFVAFLQHAGVPSVDMYYGQSYPVYHTIYDCFEWMRKFGDPYFHRHVAVSSIWGLVGLRLADDAVLSFDYLVYAHELKKYAEKLEEGLGNYKRITIEPINSAIKEFFDAAKSTAQEAEMLRKTNEQDGQWVLRRRAFNDRLMFTEKAFLDSQGLSERPWFKHLIYAPSSSKEDGFAVVEDAIAMGRGEEDVQHEIWRVARRISQAAAALQGNFT